MPQTQMESSFEIIINMFHAYSVRQSHPDKLNKGELKQLIEKELPNLILEATDKSTMDKIFKDLDKNKDNEVDFEEFMALITKVLITCHNKIHGHGHGHGHGHSH
uniref:Protein S100 n=1 Tax=Sphenodon punctatus TaxID=8508 RepID=A0A8D0GI43_SPHPU